MEKFQGSTNNDDDDSNTTLFYARNEYYVGNYMGSINFVLPEQSTANNELLAYMYLSYLAIDSRRLISNDIKDTDTTALRAFRYINDVFECPSKTEEILQLMTDKLASSVINEEETNIWHLATALVHCHCGQFENALKILHGSTNLESMAMSVQCMLCLNRIDLARQIVSKMQEIADDASLTQLVQAWIAMATGTEQMQDAFHIFQEFCEKYKPTSLLLNGQAVCLIGQGHYEEAEAVLREALSKKHNDYDTLINIMVLSHLTGKSAEVITRYWEQLRQFHPKSDFITDLDKKSIEFDELCLQYSTGEECK